MPLRKKHLLFILSLLLIYACHPARQTSTARPGPRVENNPEKPAPVVEAGPVKDAPDERAATLIQIKYSGKLGINPENIRNITLYGFIDTWYGSPYRYGGKSREGVDCSGFTSILYRDVFNKALSGPSTQLYNLCDPVDKKALKEGDLIFFRINANKISHVGVYLQNNKFVHASTRAGVIISDLEEAYYKKYYFAGGRPR